MMDRVLMQLKKPRSSTRFPVSATDRRTRELIGAAKLIGDRMIEYLVERVNLHRGVSLKNSVLRVYARGVKILYLYLQLSPELKSKLSFSTGYTRHENGINAFETYL